MLAVIEYDGYRVTFGKSAVHVLAIGSGIVRDFPRFSAALSWLKHAGVNLNEGLVVTLR